MLRAMKMIKTVGWVVLASLAPCAIAQDKSSLPTPPEVWKNYDPDKGDFKESIVKEETTDGIYYRESYISAYVCGEEIRVFCKYKVNAGAKKAPGLMDVHGWMGAPNPDKTYVADGWAVMAHDYCGKTSGRKREHFTKYPQPLRHANMEREVSGGAINAHLHDRKSITDPKQTSDYVWYAIQRRVLSYLLAQKEVDPARIGARGYSYGGTIMWNLGMDSRVKAVVAYFGIGWLEYYRTRSVWMYSLPHKEPKQSPGEELYLSAIAPQAHAPYITAASLWLNGTNDHHGGHERGEQTFKSFKSNVPWSFAHQARGHHNTEKLGDNCKLWLEKHVLGKDILWPARPKSVIKLGQDGVPELHVTPANPEKIKELKMYYAIKSPVSFGRSWRDAKFEKRANTWVAKMPVLNVDDYVFGFSNIRYSPDIVISSDFEAAIPSKLGKAVATDKPSAVISEGTGAWKHVAPVEGVGGVKGFRAINQHRGTSSDQFNDPKWQAPKGSQLSFRFYCTQPQTLEFVVNRHNRAEVKITASNEWQTMALSAQRFMNAYSKKPMADWSRTQSVQIKSVQGSDITKVVFSQFKWVTPPQLPKVMIMGDSISIGYTPYVKKLLQGKAEVIHHKGNAGPTIRGLEHIDSWIGDTKWDVIHVNFGLWDMYGWEYVKHDRSPAMYEKRLETLVNRLKKTGAKLIWATTTPACPEPEVTMRKRFNADTVISPELERKYLSAAARVMKKHKIPVNDLHGLIKPTLKQHAIAPDNVHFKPEGREKLAGQVAKHILHLIETRE